MGDRSDLWSPPVRKWMLDWHSPVRSFACEGRPGKGGSGPISHLPALELEQFGTNPSFLILEGGSGFRLLLEH